MVIPNNVNRFNTESERYERYRYCYTVFNTGSGQTDIFVIICHYIDNRAHKSRVYFV